ncbi:MAG: glycoside hydrolase family 108 protein [Desulfovibrionaceae bacterium]
MPAQFEDAHAFTARWEGGLTEHPADPGGITNHGVSLRWVRSLVEQARAECRRSARGCGDCIDAGTPSCPALCDSDMDGDGDVDADDIRACTAAQAARLFKKHFWDAGRCGRLPEPLAIAMYDSAVNLGLPRAARLLQQAMNLTGESQLEEYREITVDGCVGPRTLALGKALEEADLAQYAARRLVALRRQFYSRLTTTRPSLRVFLPGWNNRCKALLQYLADKEREQ